MRAPGVSTCDMGLGDALTELGSFLDDCEARGGVVQRVGFEAVTDAGERRLQADVDLEVSVDETGVGSLCNPRVGADGTLRFAFASTTDLLPVEDHDVRVEPAAGAIEDDVAVVRFCAVVPEVTGPGGTTAASAAGPDESERPADSPGGAQHTLANQVGSDGSTEHAPELVDATAESESDDGSASAASGVSARDREVPPFKDPDLLATVYDSCDTFAEMAAELEMDVTAETVRRYMIDYDIHEPDTYRTGGATAATGDEQVVLSDGIGLPDDVTAEDLVETVERSNTIYEVKQDIDIERDDALEMLQDLNLLDLVVGRLATEGEREVTREDIVDRLREASAVQ